QPPVAPRGAGLTGHGPAIPSRPMAKVNSNSKGPADPKKRLKKLLAAMRADEDRRPPEAELVAELAGLLGADPGPLAEVDALRVLPSSAELGLLGVFELLLDRGADPATPLDDEGVSCLATLVAAPCDDARVIALVERMVARGVPVDEDSERDGPLQRAA